VFFWAVTQRVVVITEDISCTKFTMRTMLALKALAIGIASVNNYGLFDNKERPRTIIMGVEHNRYVQQYLIPSLSLVRLFV
jgi:hypothetical protein